MNEKEKILIKIPTEKANVIIKKYYQEFKKRDVNVNLSLSTVLEGTGSMWSDPYYTGKVDLVLTEKYTMLGEEITKETTISQEDIDLKEMFNSILDLDNYEVNFAYFSVNTADKEEDVKLNGINIEVKEKTKDKSSIKVKSKK